MPPQDKASVQQSPISIEVQVTFRQGVMSYVGSKKSRDLVALRHQQEPRPRASSPGTTGHSQGIAKAWRRSTPQPHARQSCFACSEKN